MSGLGTGPIYWHVRYNQRNDSSFGVIYMKNCKMQWSNPGINRENVALHAMSASAYGEFPHPTPINDRLNPLNLSRDAKSNRSYMLIHTPHFFSTGHGLTLLHAGSFRMVHFDLCSTHLPPVHMIPYILDCLNYKRWLENTSTITSTGGRKKRRF